MKEKIIKGEIKDDNLLYLAKNTVFYIEISEISTYNDRFI